MLRTGRWTEIPQDERQAIWWGLVWTVLNIGLVVLLVLAASAA